MTIPLIIFAAVIGGAAGFFLAALVAAPGRDDAFRAGYRAAMTNRESWCGDDD